MVRNEPMAIWLVVFFVTRVVDEERVQSQGTTNNNAIHSVNLVVRPRLIAVLFMMEEGKRENGNPGALVVADAMNK